MKLIDKKSALELGVPLSFFEISPWTLNSPEPHNVLSFGYKVIAYIIH